MSLNDQLASLQSHHASLESELEETAAAIADIQKQIEAAAPHASLWARVEAAAATYGDKYGSDVRNELGGIVADARQLLGL